MDTYFNEVFTLIVDWYEKVAIIWGTICVVFQVSLFSVSWKKKKKFIKIY